MLIDSHCHLDAEWFGNDIPNVVQNAKNNGIEAIVTSSITLDIQQTKSIVDNYPNFTFWALGLHPPSVNSQTVQAITILIQKHKAEIVAIGEVGLDYHWVKEEKLWEQQKEAFRFFINFARRLEMPMIVHTREAETDSINILEEESAENVLMHCFSGTEIEAKRIIHNKWLISIPTSVANRKVHQMMARVVPLDLMLLETDAPYLAPNKGRNESANIKLSAHQIAEIKSTSFKEVAQKTTKNARKFYHLDERIKK